MDGSVLRGKRGGFIRKQRKLTVIYAFLIALGLWLGIKTDQLLFTEVTTKSTPYVEMIPIAFDDEPTLNENARQTLLKEYADKRKQLAELKRQQSLKAQAHRKAVAVSRSSSDKSAEYHYVVTAYTAGYESTGKRPGDAGYGLTASGEYVKEGVTVACPKSLAFGTRLHIEGVGYRECHDRGGDIVNGRLDVYIEDLK